MVPSSVTSIRNNAFRNCSSLANVFYAGTKSDWFNNITIGTYNEQLTNANIEFESKVTSLKNKSNDRFEYVETNTNKVIITNCKDKAIRTCDVANEFAGKQVITIRKNAFYK